MALIKCPECGHEVSEHAESCPKCAYPIAGGGSSQAHAGKIQTIEKTAKRYKLQQLLATFLCVGSVVTTCVGFSEERAPSAGAFGILGLVIGVIWFIMVRFMTWWHHG